MGSLSRLRTIAATFLVTSLLWGGGLIWWSNKVGYVGGTPSGAPVVTNSDQANGANVAYRPRQTANAFAGTIPNDGPSLIIPVAGVGPAQLGDTFNQARANGARAHDAIDIMAPRGTPVLAATDGTIEKLFTSTEGGLTIYMRAQDRRFIHYYAHLDAYAPGLVEGQGIRRGQVIGAVGSTGNANPEAPHLHFAVQVTTPDAKWYEPSIAINPYPLLTRQ